MNPKKDLPIGLLGSLGVVTLLYMLMSATIVLMVPYVDISPKAAFAAAFQVDIPFSVRLCAAHLQPKCCSSQCLTPKIGSPGSAIAM